MSLKYIPFILIFSLLASSMETDVSVPGFPAMAEYFNTSVASIQSTLSLNLFGFCIAAIFLGPLADRFGRRTIMIAGFVLFSVCSIGCVLTNHLLPLLLFRFLQGLGASSMWVVAYVIVADIYKGQKAMHFINVMNAVVTAAMAIAPAVGALLCAHFGWRSTYTFIALLSFISLLLFIFLLPETNPKPQPLKLRRIASEYRTLLTSYDFMLHVLAPSFVCVPYMAYIACASFLYIRELQLSYEAYAVHQSIVIALFSIISFKCDWIINKFGEIKAQKFGLFLSILGMLLIAPLTVLLPRSASVITFCMSLDSAGVAILFGIAVAKSMEFFPDMKGSSSSVMMAVRVSLCALGVWIGSVFYDHSLITSAITIACLAIPGIVSSIFVCRYSMRTQTA